MLPLIVMVCYRL